MKRPGTVHLGYAAPTGEAVRIRKHHLVATGSTQLSGKSTALEGLATRACQEDPGLVVVAFLTKRGESAFPAAPRAAPYFRHRADWQYVAAILEAAMKERMRFERPWIIKASRGAKTLRDVRDNVERALASAKGLAESVYTTLLAYLDIVVPELERARLGTALDLRPGVNVMDLTGLREQVQGLVIAATIQAVHEGRENTLVLLPEAWKFMPEGRKGPVQVAAEALAREGAAVGNLLWVDSQDIAGVDKAPLKMADVWLLGRQREKNEVERALKQMPVPRGAKPSPDAVMNLPLGHFVACTEEGARVVYAQPAWLPDTMACEVAMGRRTPEEAAATARRTAPRAEATRSDAARAEAKQAEEDEDMEWKAKYEAEHAARLDLQREVDELRREVGRMSDKADKVEAEVRAAVRAAKSPVRGSDAGGDPAAAQHNGDPMGPADVRLRVERPSLSVAVDRPVVQLNDRDLRGRVALLIHDGFFDEPRDISAVYREAEARGWGRWNKNGNAKAHLLWFAQRYFLRMDGDSYAALPRAKDRVQEAVP